MLIMCNVIMILYDAAMEISSCSVRKLVDPPSKLLYTASGKSGIRNKESNTPKENTEFSGSLYPSLYLTYPAFKTPHPPAALLTSVLRIVEPLNSQGTTLTPRLPSLTLNISF